MRVASGERPICKRNANGRAGGPDVGWRLRAGEVVIVDEAGMCSSRDLARIIVLATDAKAKVVLVGDHAQLDAIDAGGLLRLLAHDLDAAQLTALHRFSNTWERNASLQLRDRKPSAIRAYAEHGRIGAGDRLAVIDDTVTRWQHARADGHSVVICGRDRATVADINHRIRSERVRAGEVHPDGLALDDDTTIGVGDEIVTLRNDRTLLTSRGGWVRNGDRWRIDAIHHDGAITIDDLAGRGRTTLPADYAAEHVDLGYALTIHKAQGVTVDRAVLVADDHRQHLGLLAEQVDRLSAHEADRTAWHDRHKDTFTYRDHLAGQVDMRALELGLHAAVDPPDHLTHILGPCPSEHPARDRWIHAAARVEAYREEWDVAPPTSIGHPSTACSTASGAESSTCPGVSKRSVGRGPRLTAPFPDTVSNAAMASSSERTGGVARPRRVSLC